MSICGFLIGYCESLRPKEKKQFGKESKNPELHISHEWDKELKKGAQIVMSKKANQDQEVPQKAKKEKKKQEKEDNFFIHRFQVVKRFEQIKVLSPSNVAEIDQAIQQLKDKMVIYSLPNEEQIEEFKRKAG